MSTLVGTIALLLKKMNDPFLHRTKTDSGDQEYRIWRDSIQSRDISMVSVTPDRLKTGQVNQAVKYFPRKTFGWGFLPCGVFRLEASNFRFED
jgi:hypothetical protein